MMNYQIVSYSGVGPIRLGMAVDEVRRTIGGEFSSFRKSEDSPMPTDVFCFDAVHVYYDASGIAEAVELFSPANPQLEGEQLIGKPFVTALEWFRQRDSDLEVDGSGLRSPKYGVGLYAPAALKEPGQPIEAVIVFRQDYYKTQLRIGVTH